MNYVDLDIYIFRSGSYSYCILSHKQIVRSVVLLVVMLLVIGGDDCVGIMVSGNLVTVTVRARQ